MMREPGRSRESAAQATDELRPALGSQDQLQSTNAGETNMSTQTNTNIGQVGTVIVPVGDQDRAIEFYTGKLGFEKRSDIPMGSEMRWVEVAPAGAATTIAIVPPRPGEPTGVSTGIALASEDVDADHAALAAAGVDVDAEVSRMGDPVPPMFWFRDQDGNQLLIVQRQ
jgi:predicted enzyme related to lactoylglutathione lyase